MIQNTDSNINIVNENLIQKTIKKVSIDLRPQPDDKSLKESILNLKQNQSIDNTDLTLQSLQASYVIEEIKQEK